MNGYARGFAERDKSQDQAVSRGVLVVHPSIKFGAGEGRAGDAL